jgi:hypothetical protein
MNIPLWAVEAAFALVRAITKLVDAQTDAEREEALMQAAEASKAALDRKKFG